MIELVDNLRGMVQKLRRTPMPIQEIAPRISAAADKICELSKAVEEMARSIEHRSTDFFVIQEYATKYRLDYNELCDMVRKSQL